MKRSMTISIVTLIDVEAPDDMPEETVRKRALAIVACSEADRVPREAKSGTITVTRSSSIYEMSEECPPENQAPELALDQRRN